MNLIKYALIDFWKKKMSYIMFSLQLAMITLLMSSSLILVAKSMTGYKTIHEMATDNAYILEDYSDNTHISYMFANQKNIIDDLRLFYKRIISDDRLKFYTQFSYTDQLDGIGKVYQYTVSKGFLEAFDIEVCEGRLFEGKDYSAESAVVPLLVGYSVGKYYPTGSRIHFFEGGTGRELDGTVVGVLESKASYFDVNDIGIEMSLNNAYIIPMGNDVSNMSFSDIDMALSNTILFSDDVANVQSIVEMSHEKQLFTLSLANVDDALNEYLKEVMVSVAGNAVIVAAMVALTLLGMASCTKMMVRKNRYEYGIHFLSGATRQNIKGRLLIQNALCVVIAALPALVYYKFSYETLLAIIITSIIVGIVIAIDCMQVDRLTVADMIRRRE